MDDIIKLLESDSPQRALALLTNDAMSFTDIKNARDEFKYLRRDLRPTQVGQIQKDKTVKGQKVEAVRIPVAFQNKIVNTATAFEVGEPITLLPTIMGKKVNRNKLTDEIKRLVKVNRFDNKLQKAIALKKSELQCAVLFYIEDIDEPQNLFNRLLGANKKREIKTKILENKNGSMAPYFDSFGDMKAFTWQFDTKEDGKTVQNTWVYTDKYIYKFTNRGSSLVLENGKPEEHLFTKIPVVYMSQEQPEWFIAQPMIDRIEVALSKLGASNDYSGHPILMLYGAVAGAPDKDEDGKALRFNMIKDEDTNKIEHGDAKFLTHDGAPESVRLELDRLEKYIYSLTSTPDISFDNLKSLGDVSGIAIKLMFLDAIMKAKLNEGDNRTAVERMLNIMISGITNTTITSLKSEAANTYFDIQFNSILPDDIQSSVETYARAVEAGIVSVETAVADLDLTEDNQKEVENIRRGKAEKAANAAKTSVDPQDPPADPPENTDE